MFIVISCIGVGKWRTTDLQKVTDKLYNIIVYGVNLSMDANRAVSVDMHCLHM